MNETALVLDASALLATIFDENGGDVVAGVIGHALISSVNLSEVVARLQDKGYSDKLADEVIDSLNVTVIPFDAALAIDAGRLRGVTRHAGLSFGDRACLALGRRLGATVLTADRAWGALDLGVAIELIR